MVAEPPKKPPPSILDAVRTSLTEEREEIRRLHNRHVSAGDLLFDRWETARFYGFGKGTSCYNNVLIIGNVEVGEDSWIGPNVVLDGTGGLYIGSYVSISAGCQIYSHHTVKWSTSLGKNEIDREPTRIGDGVYIGPNSIVEMGVTIGDQSVIGAMSFVNRDIPPGSKAFGIPAQPL